MKILWCTIDRSMHSAQHFDWFQKAVADVNNVNRSIDSKVDFIRLDTRGFTGRMFGEAIAKGDLDIGPVITKHLNKNDDYDFIFTDSLFAFKHPEWEDIKIPKGYLLEDLHEVMPKQQVEFAIQHGFDAVFTRYLHPLKEFHPEVYNNHKIFWLPHCIVKEDFVEYATHNKKVTDVLHTGNVGKYYPFRKFIINSLKDKPYFKHIPRIHDKHRATHPTGVNYIKELSLAKIHPTDGSKLNYAVCKFMQIPASNCLLMSPYFFELHELGFTNGENFVATNYEALVSQIEYYLKHEDERKRISKNGQDLIFEKHTTEVRAKEFLKQVETII